MFKSSTTQDGDDFANKETKIRVHWLMSIRHDLKEMIYKMIHYVIKVDDNIG